MKVFTNTNYATGKAKSAIKANRIVGISTADGDVIQALAATVPIGVSHNFDTDAGQPVTVVPIGAGFARVKAGETLELADLGEPVGADADGRVVKSYTYAIGVLAGLSADNESATAAAANDDVVVLLSNILVSEAPVSTKGTATFTVKGADGNGVAGVAISLTVDGGSLVKNTDVDGKAEFELDADTYAWTATKAGYTIVFASGSVVIAADADAAVALLAVQTKGTAKFTALAGATPELGVLVSITLNGKTLSGLTDAAGEVEFELDAGTYVWAASKETKTIAPATDSVVVTAGATENIALAVS